MDPVLHIQPRQEVGRVGVPQALEGIFQGHETVEEEPGPVVLGSNPLIAIGHLSDIRKVIYGSQFSHL